jgi:hypothetical protein
VAACDTVDVALIDDASVGVEEVERDRRAAPLPRSWSVDRRCGRPVGVLQRPERAEQPAAERVDAGMDL